MNQATVEDNYFSESKTIVGRTAFFDAVENITLMIEQGKAKQTAGLCSILDVKRGEPMDDVYTFEFESIPRGFRYYLGFNSYHGQRGGWSVEPVWYWTAYKKIKETLFG